MNNEIIKIIKVHGKARKGEQNAEKYIRWNNAF